MSAAFKDYPADYFQSQLFPSNVFDLLPDDHDCFVYRDLFEQLDISEVDAQYSRRGQHAYAPRQVVSILIYAYSHGVFSSRQIEKRCNEDLGFMHIAGKRCPNFRVLSDFRKDQGEVGRALDELEASSGRLPDKVSLDNGYYSGDNLQAVSDRGVEAYIATDRGEKPAKTGLEDSDRLSTWMVEETWAVTH